MPTPVTLYVLCRNHPYRTIALATTECVLVFRHTAKENPVDSTYQCHPDGPQCMVEFSDLPSADLKGYKLVGEGRGTLGLITLNKDIFLCVVTSSSKAATVRPEETILRIDNVDFYCLNRSDFENGLDHEADSRLSTREPSYHVDYEGKDAVIDHPSSALKKLLNDGSFYYSLDFDLTDRVQNRGNELMPFEIDNLDEDFLWNSYLIEPLLRFRKHLTDGERKSLDSSGILTCVIRGFASTLMIPASVPLLSPIHSNLPSTLTVISRLSSRRAGTRFNSRGIDDDGNVANFVETETILWCHPVTCFSYVQTRGSVPIFWEQAASLLSGQPKIEITRSFEATQLAFDRHFEALELKYGRTHVINLLSETKFGEEELLARFHEHIAKACGFGDGDCMVLDDCPLQLTEFDFNAETRDPIGYEGAGQLRYRIEGSVLKFAYFLSEEKHSAASSLISQSDKERRFNVLSRQEGVFRTNCLDCLDRTNLVQTIISLMTLERFFRAHGRMVVPDLHMRHSSLWADNGDALSRIYAGTGALKSSFTRYGRMSLAGVLADARKSATRFIVNTFTDKARQHTIDLLLGRLANQDSVHLYDPVNDMVAVELGRRAAEYSSTKVLRIWVGTFNLSGQSKGLSADLSPWLLSLHEQENPSIVAIGFQEMVELSPQQIMSTDAKPRFMWEEAVEKCLNNYSERRRTGKYVLLRSGQLVGTALLIYVKSDILGNVKNVEGGVKMTGLSGMAGNKGGCAIRFEYLNTRLCFVTAHLAAGFANYEDRNRDYATICHGLRFQKNRSIEDHDTIIWLGDFNYRIELGDAKVRELIQQKKYDILFEKDQLNLQMVAGRTFQFYLEGSIGFPPTYKYNIGTDEYDISERARIPAWCDRILWRGRNLTQERYSVGDLNFSDHRPVWAVFKCTADSINEKMRSLLRDILHDQIHHKIGRPMNSVDGEKPAEEWVTHEFSSVSYPLASPERHMWWLSQGAQVKSQLQPPIEGNVPNMERPPNPFLRSEKPDWIDPHFPTRKGVPSSSSAGGNTQPSITTPKELERTGGSSPIPSTRLRNPKMLPPPIPTKPDSLKSKRKNS